ncbi:microtubule-associated protein 70-3-like [Helianthus annuus]|uniref:microtubule-associated protein 70-3-like n=1 Tax=Helianthus annuus TaxID=4232 RepID=UPI001652BD6A|nr:microtubule-associated protein 70-3-like [Helianthus annuus]
MDPIYYFDSIILHKHLPTNKFFLSVLSLLPTFSYHKLKARILHKSKIIPLILQYTTPLTFSGSYKDRGSGGGRGSGTTSCRGSTVRPSLDTNNLIKLFHGLDSLKLQLNRLEIEVTDYDREPSESQS